MVDDDEAVAPRPDTVQVVGIGASAGGLEALEDFVSNLTPDSGLAWLVVQHLSPDHESIMDRLLAEYTTLPIVKVEDGDEVRPDHIYIMPAGYEARFDGSRLRLSRQDRSGLRTLIDTLFTSIAAACGGNAFGIILSGTGSDGTNGIREIKAKGGVAIVQASQNARFPGMPDSAMATGLVDFVMNAGDMPKKVLEIAHHRAGFTNEAQRRELMEEIEGRLPAFTEHLLTRHDHDFSDYKNGTLVRRIERRMSLLRYRTVEAYLEKLAEDEAENARLLQDFLIGVTRFFRDPEFFSVLRDTVVRPLLETDRKAFRVWVPGCSTGEEAYSIALLFLTEMAARNDHRALQIFGTDIDQPALLRARAGTYPPAALAELSDSMRDDWFTFEGGTYQAKPSLREACVFAPHNLIQDPPFSRLDLISCRNLMIYLNVSLQRQIIPRFHFALRKGGFLFLGPAEGLAGCDDYFDVIDGQARVFARNDETAPRFSPPKGKRSRIVPRTNPLVQVEPTPKPAETDVRAEQVFLAKRAPPFAVVTRKGSVTYVSEAMVSLVKPQKGKPSADIDSYLRRELRTPVRSALAEASRQGDTASVPNVIVGADDGQYIYDVFVEPIEEEDDRYLVTLQPVRPSDVSEVAALLGRRDAQEGRALEYELASTRRQLQMAEAEFESSSQRLQATNEELLSMNEELQSSNEELETSREELQSINEELETLNAELSENNLQLQRANSDVKNLFESTEIAVLFLDSQLCVRSFTPATSKLFGIRARDTGRPISDLSARVDYPDLAADAEYVSRTLERVERELTIAATDETFLLRMRPYRTTDDRFDGHVLTFIDITDRTRFERQIAENADALSRQYSELETLYDTAPVGLSLIDRDLRWLRINRKLAEINGFSVEEHLGKRQDELIPDINEEVADIQRRVFDTGEAVLGIEVHGVTPAEPDRARDWITDYYPVIGADGTVFAIGTCVREVTEQKMLLRKVEASEQRMKSLFDSAPIYIAVTRGPRHVYDYVNPKHDELTGGRSVLGLPLREAFPHLPDSVYDVFDRVYEAGEGIVSPELPVHFDRDGESPDDESWFTFVTEPVRDENGTIIGVTNFSYDITGQVRAREHARESEARKTVLLGELQHRVKNTLATVAAITRFTADGVDDVDTYQARLGDRLSAISRTHDLLTATDWKEAKFSDLVREEMAPYGREGHDCYELSGPDFLLKPKEALAVGLGIHELSTNAAKYGALSVQHGIVRIGVRVDADDPHRLTRRVVWREEGGPLVPPPGTRVEGGFGSFLLQTVLQAETKGRTTMSFAADGLVVEIALP